MHRVIILGEPIEEVSRLAEELASAGYSSPLVSDIQRLAMQVAAEEPQVALVHAATWPLTLVGLQPLLHRRGLPPLPIVALLEEAQLRSLDSYRDLDDFVVKPWRLAEVVARVERALGKKADAESRSLVRCGGLSVDLIRYDVRVDGELVDLTYKEYELLRFLLANKEKVFTREALLNKVWGYDYYGGTRTVDVHIRRLRSKIENSSRTYIETVRNVGYRFRQSDGTS